MSNALATIDSAPLMKPKKLRKALRKGQLSADPGGSLLKTSQQGRLYTAGMVYVGRRYVQSEVQRIDAQNANLDKDDPRRKSEATLNEEKRSLAYKLLAVGFFGGAVVDGGLAGSACDASLVNGAVLLADVG